MLPVQFGEFCLYREQTSAEWCHFVVLPPSNWIVPNQTESRQAELNRALRLPGQFSKILLRIHGSFALFPMPTIYSFMQFKCFCCASTAEPSLNRWPTNACVHFDSRRCGGWPSPSSFSYLLLFAAFICLILLSVWVLCVFFSSSFAPFSFW